MTKVLVNCTVQGLLSGIAGAAIAVPLVAHVGLDNALVAAYRAGRAYAFRVVTVASLVPFTVALGISLCRRNRAPPGFIETFLAGAAGGYVAGFATWWVMRGLTVSGSAVIGDLAKLPSAMLAPLVVAALSFSWLSGGLAFVITRVVAPRMTRRVTPPAGR